MSKLANDAVAPPSRSGHGRILVLAVTLIAAAAGTGWWWTHRTAAAEAGGTATQAKPAPSGTAGASPSANGNAARKSGRGGAPSVVVARTRRGALDIWSDALGTVTPLANVTIHSRVDGQLMRVLFHEGQQVRSGDLLAEIDPRPYQVILDQALAQQARDRALLDNARVDLSRYHDLADHDAVPRQQLDTQISLVAQYQAAVRTDQAAIDSARLNLEFCRIESPLAGQVGLRQVDPGNIVHAADTTGLVVVAQMDPISVLFSLPQDQLPQLQQRLRSHQAIAVQALDRSGARVLADGSLASVDNQIDTTTGAIKLRARFSNRSGALYPNQFVNLRVLLDTRTGVVIAPTAALQRGAQGTYVYVLKVDHTVTVRPVTTGPVNRGDMVIDAGLADGEQVVIDGIDKLREGLAVEVADAAGGGAAPAPGKAARGSR
ncbi:MAG: MdtA/MuxA family multidrug efflux RND transporter periplasmic adaptor subunit [Pseudomonadota bacterium]|nr:MdtA/MuxA family multidrug efflux RND transporter periplasmic adaptor subunit [Pseudomonadota bacterium]